MAGGDLKQLVLGAMSKPFDPPYNKSQAFKWAMHIAEALHYLHCVCTPMIIHRDLKLDNILLSGTDADTSVVSGSAKSSTYTGVHRSPNLQPTMTRCQPKPYQQVMQPIIRMQELLFGFLASLQLVTSEVAMGC